MSEAEGAMRLTDELVAKIENLRPYNPAQIARWLDYLHGSRVGWLEVFAAFNRHDLVTGWFHWPDERRAAIDHIVKLLPTRDVWAAALLKDSRSRGTELPGRFAWVDADAGKLTPRSEAAIERLHPAVVLTGSPGNRQLWFPLEVPTDRAQIKQINRLLIDQIGGDPKFSPDSVMRIPGTLNHKPCYGGEHICNRVRWQEFSDVTTWDSGTLIFGGTAEPDELTDDTERDPGMPEALPIDTVPVKLRKAWGAPATDPSGHTMHVAYVAASLFPDDAHVLWALEQDEITLARRAEKKHDQPGWWPSEWQRLITLARAKYPSESAGSTVAGVLRQMAIGRYEFYRADDGEPFALPREGPKVVRMLRGDKYSLRAELSDVYSGTHGHPPGNGALADALTSLEGLAQRTGKEVPLPLRVARWGDSLVLDLGDDTGQAVVVHPGSWEIVASSPVLFRRTRLTAPLPIPARGRTLSDTVFPLLNVPREDRALMAAILVSMLFPDIPHPIPLLTGGEGVAKTSTTRVLRSMVDPSSVPTRGRPDEKEWDVALAAQWVVALDNLSEIRPWLSDALCRAVTGEGMVRRKLYTDLDMTMISARRCLVLNGISAIPANADLAGRTIVFELEPIQQYRDETRLAADWAAVWPYALGALLDQAAIVLAKMDDTQLDAQFRMADFARITATMDQVNGTRALSSYQRRLADAAEDVLAGDEVATAILRWAKTLTEPWEGSLMALNEALIKYQGGKTAGWPKPNPNVWVARIRRITNPLRRMGVQIYQGQRTEKARQWVVSRDDLS